MEFDHRQMLVGRGGWKEQAKSKVNILQMTCLCDLMDSLRGRNYKMRNRIGKR